MSSIAGGTTSDLEVNIKHVNIERLE
jgi:hypothetical protein